ncbi:MAG: hypothetical protein AAFR88_10000, partial [Pseudomonadota bacterium]
MSSFELSKLQGVSAPRALTTSDRAKLETGSGERVSGPLDAAAKPGVALEIGTSLEAGQPPINAERVAEIREALRDGSYPLVP